LRVLRLEEVSVWISYTIGKGVWFYSQVFAFLLCINCKRLREFEEIEISSKAVEVTVNNKEENSYDFVKNSTSVYSSFSLFSSVLIVLTF
jgi:hypothetical protein